MKRRSAWIVIIFIIGNVGCSPPTTNPLDPVVQDYIQTYKERQDWAKFCSFYSDTVYMKDQAFDMEFKSLKAFQEFYNWPDTNFRKLSPDQESLSVTDLLIKGQTAVIRGRFTPFYWKGQLQDWPNGYTIWLYFNEDHKIVKQLDYIHYPPELLPPSE